MVLEVKRLFTIYKYHYCCLATDVSNFKICFCSTDKKFLQCFKNTTGAFIF